jgi:hypothetical protein
MMPEVTVWPTPVGEFDAYVLGAVNDVVVGQNVAVRADDDAGAEAALDALLGARRLLAQAVAEEVSEKGVIHEGVLLRLARAARSADGDDGRRDTRHHVCVGVLHGVGACRRGRRRNRGRRIRRRRRTPSEICG